MTGQPNKSILIDPLTIISLHIEIYFNDVHLSNATGFLCKKDDDFYLVTNWHVLSGRNPETNEPLSKELAIPNKIKIWHHRKNKLGFLGLGFGLVLRRLIAGRFCVLIRFGILGKQWRLMI